MSLSVAQPPRLTLPGALWRGAIWAAVLLAIAVVIAVLDPFYVPLAALAGVLAVVIVVHPLVAVPLLLFAVPFGGLARPDATETDLAAGPTEVLVAFLALAWLAHGVRRQRIRVRDGAIVVAIIAFAMLSLLSIGYAIEPGPAVKESLKWLELLIVLVVVVDLARTQRSVSWLLATLFVAGAAEALYGVYQFATGSGPATFEVQGALRAFGHFDQPNPFAGYLSTILPLAVLIVCCGQAARPLRACAALSALAIAGGVALSQSRGAWLGVATAGLVLLVLWSPRTRLLLLPIAAVTAVFGAAALGNLLPASVADRLSQAVEYFGVFDVRTVEPAQPRTGRSSSGWPTGRPAGTCFWIIPGSASERATMRSAYPFYYVATWLEPLGHAHNYYLNMLAELGTVGLAILLVLLALLFRELAGGLLTTTTVGMSFWRAVLAGVVGGLVVFCVHNMFDNLFVHSVNVQLGVHGWHRPGRRRSARGSQELVSDYRPPSGAPSVEAEELPDAEHTYLLPGETEADVERTAESLETAPSLGKRFFNVRTLHLVRGRLRHHPVPDHPRPDRRGRHPRSHSLGQSVAAGARGDRLLRHVSRRAPSAGGRLLGTPSLRDEARLPNAAGLTEISC